MCPARAGDAAWHPPERMSLTGRCNSALLSLRDLTFTTADSGAGDHGRGGSGSHQFGVAPDHVRAFHHPDMSSRHRGGRHDSRRQDCPSPGSKNGGTGQLTRHLSCPSEVLKQGECRHVRRVRHPPNRVLPHLPFERLVPPAPIFLAARPGEDPMNLLAVALLADVFRSAPKLPLPRGFPGTGLHVARVCKLQLLRCSLVSPLDGLLRGRSMDKASRVLREDHAERRCAARDGHSRTLAQALIREPSRRLSARLNKPRTTFPKADPEEGEGASQEEMAGEDSLELEPRSR